MKRLLHLIGLTGLIALAAPVWAGEYVVLGSGLRLHADRHETEGGTVRIFSGDGVVEMPQTVVAGYEQEETLAAVPSASAPVPEDKSEDKENKNDKTPVPPAPLVAKPETPAELAELAARKYLLPDSFVKSVMKAESGFQPNAISPKGAIGLMQLMPETARVLGVDPRDPHQNADGGAQYLRQLLAKYESDPNQVLLALAAYNAGPAAVERYHGVPPYRETREYILRVLKNWDQTSESKSGK
jgi:soluble lytic murein transglycosylase-like protein